jgi:hypothetical protein
MCWKYKSKCLKVPPEGYYGFVYLITNLVSGRIYVGKKAFSYKKKTRLSKRAKKSTGSTKRIKIESIDSQWLSYFGSSEELKLDVKTIGEKQFKREILHLCKSKAQMSYLEAKEQFKREVLEDPNSYNKWIGVKVFKTKYLIE